LSVNAARPTRDSAHIARLFEHRMERLRVEFDAGFGIDQIRLAATSVSGLHPRQTDTLLAESGDAELDGLYDRMTSRLGPLALTRMRFRNTHIPERAVRLEPVVAPTPPDPAAAPDPHLPRPVQLLPVPERITVVAEVPDGPPARMEWRKLTYRFVGTLGPERIGVEWWQPGETALTRDYYVAEDETGHRFWLFREGLYASEAGHPQWFMHGFFA
ncbi:MAG TPA: DNA polymerase Y family protein, partial [Devosiaceae bacterium]|nr:DNA polymerase Y family protein [Devosiaceae bacterium]